MRLIDADLLGLSDMEIVMCDGDYKEALKMLIDKIERAPTIDPQRTGKWIRNPDDTAGSGYFICSECGIDFYDVWKAWKYCPNCGAKME